MTVPVCWKHQLMTFITNDLDPQAVNLDSTDLERSLLVFTAT